MLRFNSRQRGDCLPCHAANLRERVRSQAPSSESLLFSAATQPAVATPRDDGCLDMQSVIPCDCMTGRLGS